MLGQSDVLRLQRTIGNRAVAQLMAPRSVSQVRRVLQTSAPPPVQRVFGRNMRRRIKENEYPNLMPLVEKARAKTATREELEKGLREVAKYSNAAAKMQGVDVAQRLDKLGAIGDALHKAEAAAIGAFTRNDFQYINPAAAHNKKWLKSQAEADSVGGSQKQQLEEGALHAGMMMAGMKKLDEFKGEGYRGERLTPEQFAEQYTDADGVVSAKKPTQVKASFWSVSLERDVAESFAKDSTNRNATISVLYIITLISARDLREISASAQEAEVLCTAGSKLTVTNTQKLSKGPAGNPEATAWYLVSMSQTAGGERRLE